jgi:hypothetical protein
MLIILTLIIGLIVILINPFRKQKIAILWVAIGLIQIAFLGLVTYPYVFLYIQSEVAFGLLILTCGIFLFSFTIPRIPNARRIVGTTSLLLLGFLEIAVFIKFFLSFPDITKWNVMIDAISSIAFLVASVLTFTCGIFLFHRLGK